MEQMYYRMNIAGCDRALPLCPLTDDLMIGAFVIFGDPELTTACSKARLEKVPEYDYMITAEAIGVTDPVATRPVFRPCIGLDKEDIVVTSRKIGTFETSIEPFEDCCTVFTPRHPRTRPDLQKVLAQEQKLPFDELVEEAIAGMYRVDVTPEGYEVRQ